MCNVHSSPAPLLPSRPRPAAPPAGGPNTAGGAPRQRRAVHAQARSAPSPSAVPPPEGIPSSTTRLKATVAYDGGAFAGFQWQKGKVRTVQGELERAAGRVFHMAGRITGASRTDGGAHALGQVVHFDVFGERVNFETDAIYFNAVLPDDVKVASIEAADPAFDSQFMSLGKEYHYLLSCGMPEPMHAKQRWWVHNRWCERSRGKPSAIADIALDVGAMQQAAQLLCGCHDFSAFMDVKRPSGLGSVKRKRPGLAAKGIKPVRTPQKNTRTLWRADVVEEGPGLVRLEVAGDGFLYRMVRMLATGLVEVGHRRLSAQQLQSVLQRGERSALPEAAPPHGLYLRHVFYDLASAKVPERLRGAVAARAAQKRAALGQGGQPAATAEEGSDEDEG